MLFSSKNTSTYLFTVGIVLVASYFANTYKQNFETNDEYELIKKYLLNDSPLYGHNRPKIWVHTEYKINSRKWKDFYSRNTTDLNQPYIHLTIKTIIDHCGDDFNICLIDDESFRKLIPSWDYDLERIAEPRKSQLRELGLMQLLYYYGGMLVPNSFVCTKNLKLLYEDGIVWNKPFICQNINHTTNLLKKKNNLLFMPSTCFMGASKNNETILQFIEYLKARNSNQHMYNENEFVGDSSHWCLNQVNNNNMNLIDGQLIGVKNMDNKPILLDNLMEESYINFYPDMYGIYIPSNEILKRHKYEWFACLSSKEVLQSNAIISKYLLSAIADGDDIYQQNSELRSVVTI
tara:strand:+ start:6793 stop:7836 length:1044 start_codon:yes stop_codon:yes gene_type:complete